MLRSGAYDYGGKLVPLRKEKPETHYDFQGGTQHAVRPAKEKLEPRIGLYAGSFDPVHAGHIKFALRAQKLAGLQHVYFMPERRPKQNSEAEHYVHRAVMLKRALRPYAHFSLIDLPDARLSTRSVPRIREQIPQASLSLLTSASDLLWHEGELPKLYNQLHLVVAVTSHAQMAEVLARVTGGASHLQNLTFVDIGTDHISSSAVRQGLRQGKQVHGVLPSVWRYARRQWLYISPLHR
jgi:nicotinate-nucleotide adenylyltransferase